MSASTREQVEITHAAWREACIRRGWHVKKPTDFYFSGPCKHGHVGPYYVSSQNCVECTIKRSRKWRAENPEESNACLFKWRAENPELAREMHRNAQARYRAREKAKGRVV